MPEENLFEHAARTVAEPPPPAVARRPEDIQDRYEIWIANNPQVLTDFIRLAREAKARGKTRIGSKLLCEVLRWETWMNSDQPDDDDFKFNNTYTSRLVRSALETAPDLAGMFELRKLKSA